MLDSAHQPWRLFHVLAGDQLSGTLVVQLLPHFLLVLLGMFSKTFSTKLDTASHHQTLLKTFSAGIQFNRRQSLTLSRHVHCS
jgi:hypothetical protein